jgi:hypothetical protein
VEFESSVLTINLKITILFELGYSVSSEVDYKSAEHPSIAPYACTTTPSNEPEIAHEKHQF